MTNLQSLNSNRIFDNKLAVTSGNGSSFNTGLFTESRRTGGAECFPKKNTAPVCVDYASTTNRGLWCSVHRLQEPAPNCRSLLRDGGQTLNWVGDNGSPAPHSKFRNSGARGPPGTQHRCLLVPPGTRISIQAWHSQEKRPRETETLDLNTT